MSLWVPYGFLAVILVFLMHLQALEVGLRLQFNEMSAGILAFPMHLQALELGLRVHVYEMCAVILVFQYMLKHWR